MSALMMMSAEMTREMIDDTFDFDVFQKHTCFLDGEEKTGKVHFD